MAGPMELRIQSCGNMFMAIKKAGTKPFAFILFTTILFAVRNLSGISEMLCLIVESEIWSSVVECLTMPVLFLLVNGVILSIWLSSGGSFYPKNGWGSNSGDAEEVLDAKTPFTTFPYPASPASISIRSPRAFKSPAFGRESFFIDYREGKGIRIQAFDFLDESISTEKNAKETNMPKLEKQEYKEVGRNDKGSRVLYEKKMRKSKQVMRRNGASAVQKHDRDELNDRIEAFCAKFRQQLKLQSLQEKDEA